MAPTHLSTATRRLQDMQSIATTMDGKFLLIITAGFQRFASGLFGARAAGRA